MAVSYSALGSQDNISFRAVGSQENDTSDDDTSSAEGSIISYSEGDYIETEFRKEKRTRESEKERAGDDSQDSEGDSLDSTIISYGGDYQDTSIASSYGAIDSSQDANIATIPSIKHN